MSGPRQRPAAALSGSRLIGPRSDPRPLRAATIIKPPALPGDKRSVTPDVDLAVVDALKLSSQVHTTLLTPILADAAGLFLIEIPTVVCYISDVPAADSRCPPNAEEIAEAYVRRKLPEPDAAAFEAHYIGCPKCVQILADAEAFVHTMRAAGRALDGAPRSTRRLRGRTRRLRRI